MKERETGREKPAQLLTEDLRQQIPVLYSQKDEEDPLVVCKFFDPVGSWTWYAIEGSPVDEDGYVDTDKAKVDFLFFGFVVGLVPELGYFYLKELETARQGLTGAKASPIERDTSFIPCRLSDIKKTAWSSSSFEDTVDKLRDL